MKVYTLMCVTVLFAGCTSAIRMDRQIDDLYEKLSQEEREEYVHGCTFQ